MINVAIVDDENIVRLGLKTLIDWEAYGYSLAGIFENGSDALGFCIANPVDILISDVKMPAMDGITLINRITNERPEISIIILSNYDDFEYVSNAYKLGIKEYLLKQFLEPYALLKALEAARQDVLKGKNYDGSLPKNSGGDKKRRKAVYKLLIGKDIDEQEKEFAAIGQNGGNYFCACIHLYSNAADYNPYDPAAPDIAVLQATIVSSAKKYCMPYGCFFIDGRFILAASVSTLETSNKIERKTANISRDLSFTLESYFNMKCHIGISGIEPDYMKLSKLYSESVHKAGYGYFYYDRVLFETSGSNHKTEHKKNIEAMENKIRHYLKKQDFKEAYKQLISILDSFEQYMQVGEHDFKLAILNIFNETMSSLKARYDIGLLPEAAEDSYMEKIMISTSIKELRAIIDGLVNMIFNNISSYRSKNIAVEQAKEYINANYAGSISLDGLLPVINLSKNHFCKLFKENTGTTFTAYLNSVRIDKAIDYINTTNYSTDYIAEKVGFQNTNYFVRVFKKITGKTLTEHKNTLQNSSPQ